MTKKEATVSAARPEFAERLRQYLAAAYPLLLVETHEEARALREILNTVKEATSEARKALAFPWFYTWDCCYGLMAYNDAKSTYVAVSGPSDGSTVDVSDLIVALAQIGFGSNNPSHEITVVLQDFHRHVDDPVTVRWLRNLVRGLKKNQQRIIFISPYFNLPAELRKEVQLVEFALPSKDRLATVFRALVKDNDPEAKLEDVYVESVVEAAVGMTAVEAENAMALAAIATKQDQKLVLEAPYVRRVFEEKITALRDSFLDYIPTPGGFEAVGGLTPIKEWAKKRRLGFDAAARALHLPYPKGALITGYKGTGKTTVAMAIAAAWTFPLYKLDMGRLFGSKVGESEQNLRHLLRLLDGIGRAVVLIDEIDKSLSVNATSGGGDSGTSSRMFGTFLGWMSSKQVPVFVIGTCNHIEALPSELIRRGRFDEVFFVDLPGDLERVAIINALLKHRFKSGLVISVADAEFIRYSKDFSGAELEALIIDVLYGFVEEPDEPLSKRVRQLLLDRLQEVKPQARVDEDLIKAMRRRAQSGFVRANDRVVEEEVLGGDVKRSLGLN